MSERTTDRTDAVLEQALAALRHSRDHLAAVVDSMTGDEVQRPSYHSWSIAEVLSHLGAPEGRAASGKALLVPTAQRALRRVGDHGKIVSVSVTLTMVE